MSENMALTMVRKSAGAIQRLGYSSKETEALTEKIRICLAEAPYLASVVQGSREASVSLVVSVCRAMALGLDPSGGPLGHGYLVPFSTYNKSTNRKEMRVQFIPGYRGLVGLALRDGLVKAVNAEIIYEEDEWDISLGTERRILHRPDWSKPRTLYIGGDVPASGAGNNAPILVYCTWTTAEGHVDFAVMPIAEVLAIRNQSQGWASTKGRDYSSWMTAPEEMAKKTVIRRASKMWGLGMGNGGERFAEALARADIASTPDAAGLAQDEELIVVDVGGGDSAGAQDALADEL